MLLHCRPAKAVSSDVGAPDATCACPLRRSLADAPPHFRPTSLQSALRRGGPRVRRGTPARTANTGVTMTEAKSLRARSALLRLCATAGIATLFDGRERAAAHVRAGQRDPGRRAGLISRANCAGVPTGGQAALACLKQNAARVSPACQRALAAVGEHQRPSRPPRRLRRYPRRPHRRRVRRPPHPLRRAWAPGRTPWQARTAPRRSTSRR